MPQKEPQTAPSCSEAPVLEFERRTLQVERGNKMSKGFHRKCHSGKRKGNKSVTNAAAPRAHISFLCPTEL